MIWLFFLIFVILLLVALAGVGFSRRGGGATSAPQTTIIEKD